MTSKLVPAALLATCLVSGPVLADTLTQIVQRDLETLGYAPGNTDGEASVETAIAISKFQAEHGLEVTGEATPQLAGIIKAALNGNAPAAAPASAPASAPATAPGSAAPALAAAPASDPAALQAAQQACLQQKVAEAQESEQLKRGLGRLASAFSRTASRLGGDEISADISAFSSDVYTAGAIAGDFKSAAEDLGLTESDVEACRNPS